MAPHWKCGSGQPVGGSNPPLSATARAGVGSGLGLAPGRAQTGAQSRLGRAAPPCYDSAAVLGGELAVPCTCNPLQQG